MLVSHLYQRLESFVFLLCSFTFATVQSEYRNKKSSCSPLGMIREGCWRSACDSAPQGEEDTFRSVFLALSYRVGYRVSTAGADEKFINKRLNTKKTVSKRQQGCHLHQPILIQQPSMGKSLTREKAMQRNVYMRRRLSRMELCRSEEGLKSERCMTKWHP